MKEKIEQPPKVSRRVLGCFQWYVRKQALPKAFHKLAVAGEPSAVPQDAPLIVYLNHSSWWDPLVAMHLAQRCFAGRTMYAPFDSEALERYPIFEKLGFFGVDQQTRRGAAAFLRKSRAIFASPGGSLWITPEGRFVDSRDAGVPFEPGLAHLVESLASDNGAAHVLPLAIEYPFWEEKLPEALCQFGEPIHLGEHAGLDKTAWDVLLRERLRATQADLAELSIARDASAFQVLLGGDEGVGGLYEPIRWLSAKLRGREYRAAHSGKWEGSSR